MNLENSPSNLKIYLVIAITIFFWASAFVGIRIGLHDYHPGALALLRFTVASLCLFFMQLHVKPLVKPKVKETVQLLLLGVIGIGIYNICLNIGELTVSAGIASFAIGLAPVVVILLSVIFFKERLNVYAWLGLFISLVGISLMSFSELMDSHVNWGLLTVFIATCAGAVYTLLQKSFLNRLHPIQVTAYIIWGGTLLLTVFSRELVQDLQKAHWQTTLVAIYMGIFPAALAYAGWSYVVKHISPARAVMFLYCSPLLSTLLGLLILKEKPAYLSLIGGSIAVIGAMLTLPKKRLKEL